MTFGPFPTDILPKSLALAFAVWSTAAYFLVAPTIAARIVRADHVPVCEANFRDMVAASSAERARALTLPSLESAQMIAAERAQRILNSPGMRQLKALSGGLAEQFGLDIDDEARRTLQQIEESKRAAQKTYDDALAVIKAETATNLAGASGLCGCIADAAIQDTRTQWAVFAGTLSAVRLPPLDRFDEKMAQIYSAGACLAPKVGGQ